jgi:CheY-like chemotaxis protein
MSEGLCDTAGMPRPPRPLRVLHLEDSELDHDLAMALLRRNGLAIETVRVDTRHDFEAALDQPWDAIVSDFNLPGFSGLQALDIVRARDRIVPFILVSGEIGEDTAVAAMRNGASDYLLKNQPGAAGAGAGARHPPPRARPRAKARRPELVASRQRLAELAAATCRPSVEAERAAIAREIHDDVGGSLTALKFDIDWIRRHSSEPTVQQRAVSALETVSPRHRAPASG